MVSKREELWKTKITFLQNEDNSVWPMLDRPVKGAAKWESHSGAADHYLDGQLRSCSC